MMGCVTSVTDTVARDDSPVLTPHLDAAVTGLKGML